MDGEGREEPDREVGSAGLLLLARCEMTFCTVKKSLTFLIWLAVAVLGAAAYLTIAWQRGEPLNSAYLLVAALCTYAIGYRFYSKWIAAKVLALCVVRS